MVQQFPGEFRDKDGFCDVGDYAAIGEGRTVTLLSPDGSADWWCVPALDSPPLFDRLLDAENGGYFQLVPRHPYRMNRRYLANSNVLETEYETATGKVRITESVNSTLAGRLPWNEFARRIEGISGSVLMTLRMKIGTAGATRSPWKRETSHGTVWHVGALQLMLRLSDPLLPGHVRDNGADSQFTVHQAQRLIAAVLVTENEPLAVPALARIDERIDTSDNAWRNWADNLAYDGKFKSHVVRSALALKFLWFAPTGALAAAATTSLPEGIGSGKNYDYRYAWVRDACMIIKSFIYTGALEDCQAAFSWLAGILRENGCEMHTCFQLNGQPVPQERCIAVKGYRGEQPVRVGNNASRQLQLSNYGDILDTAVLFTDAGHVLDLDTSRLLAQLANHCADTWRQPDSGIWELPEAQHYTQSKMACWVALNQAVRLAKGQYIEPTWQGRWERERDRIRDWIETHCWSEERQSYCFWPGSEELDASIALMHQYGKQVSPERMLTTLRLIDLELGTEEKMLYRYTGVEKEENTFVACAFWMAAALAVLGETEDAEIRMNALLQIHQSEKSAGVMSEMYDVRQKKCCGNMPQGLSHLSVIFAAHTLSNLS